jgi:hypothetical protein
MNGSNARAAGSCEKSALVFLEEVTGRTVYPVTRGARSNKDDKQSFILNLNCGATPGDW